MPAVEPFVVRTAGMSRPSVTRVRVWQGLLWCEWFAHSKLLLVFLAGWLVTVWTLPLFAQPEWGLVFAIVYAFLAGPAYGGGDIIEGTEEFSFALPATRTERYLARLAIGGGSVLLFSVLDLLALGLDLSQALARLYLDTGLIRPRQVAQPGLLYGLVLAFPFAVFAFSFAGAAVARARPLVFTAWFWAGLVALSIMRVGFQYEEMRWTRINGVVACPALVMLGGVALVGGLFGFRRKEIGPAVAPLQLPGRWWAWALVFLLGLGLALLLLYWLARDLPAVLAAA